VFLLPGSQHVHLRTPRLQRPQRTFDAEQQHFRHVAEIEPDAASIRAAVLPDFVPDDVRFVRKAPLLHDLQGFRQQGVRTPQVQVARLLGVSADGEIADFLEAHRAIATEPAMFGGHLARAILKSPRRIDQDSPVGSSQSG